MQFIIGSTTHPRQVCFSSPSAYKYKSDCSRCLPVVAIRKELFIQYGEHVTRTVVLVLMKVAMFKHLVLAFQTLIGVETNHENLKAEIAGPSLLWTG